MLELVLGVPSLPSVGALLRSEGVNRKCGVEARTSDSTKTEGLTEHVNGKQPPTIGYPKACVYERQKRGGKSAF